MWPYIKEKDNVHEDNQTAGGAGARDGGVGGVIPSYVGLVGGGFGHQDMIVLAS